MEFHSPEAEHTQPSLPQGLSQQREAPGLTDATCSLKKSLLLPLESSKILREFLL